jgi:Carboxypeptidase regulatory-like domain
MTVRLQLCLACVLLGIVVPVAAQQPGAVAGIRGRVIDPQRRGVEARVQVIQVSSGLERETRSDAAGYFAVTSITPGDIDLIVTAQGFAERRIQGIRLEVGQAAEIEIPLRLSAVQEQITVSGDAGTVDVLGSIVGTVISAHEIESLPLNGRNFPGACVSHTGQRAGAELRPDQGAIGHRVVRRAGRARA